jgi:hypothetical protein
MFRRAQPIETAIHNVTVRPRDVFPVGPPATLTSR